MEVDLEIRIDTMPKNWQTPVQRIETRNIKLPVDMDVYNLSSDSYAILETTIIDMLKNAMFTCAEENIFSIIMKTHIVTFNGNEKNITRCVNIYTGTIPKVKKSANDIKRRCTNLFYDIIGSYNFTLAELQDIPPEEFHFTPIRHARDTISHLRPYSRG